MKPNNIWLKQAHMKNSKKTPNQLPALITNAVIDIRRVATRSYKPAPLVRSSITTSVKKLMDIFLSLLYQSNLIIFFCPHMYTYMGTLGSAEVQFPGHPACEKILTLILLTEIIYPLDTLWWFNKLTFQVTMKKWYFVMQCVPIGLSTTSQNRFCKTIQSRALRYGSKGHFSPCIGCSNNSVLHGHGASLGDSLTHRLIYVQVSCPL